MFLFKDEFAAVFILVTFMFLLYVVIIESFDQRLKHVYVKTGSLLARRLCCLRMTFPQV